MWKGWAGLFDSLKLFMQNKCMFSIKICSPESSISNKRCNVLQQVFIHEISSTKRTHFFNLRKARYMLDAMAHKPYRWFLWNLEQTYLRRNLHRAILSEMKFPGFFLFKAISFKHIIFSNAIHLWMYLSITANLLKLLFILENSFFTELCLFYIHY